jgi:hypothetical protein
LLAACQYRVEPYRLHPTRVFSAREGGEVIGQEVASRLPRHNFRTYRIALKPFVDQASGEVTRASQSIERGLLESFGEIRSISAERLSEVNAEEVDFLLIGVMMPVVEDGETTAYNLKASVVDMESGEVVSSSEARMLLNDDGQLSTPAFADQPIYPTSETVDAQADILNAEVGDVIDDEVLSRTREYGMIADAREYHDQGQYARAELTYLQAVEQYDSDRVEIWGGLYAAAAMQDKEESARQYFDSLVAARRRAIVFLCRSSSSLHRARPSSTARPCSIGSSRCGSTVSAIT